MQHNLSEGGFTGITLLFYFLWNWDPAIMNIVLNVPVFIIGLRELGRKTFIYTIIGTLSVSLFLYISQANHFNLAVQSDMTLVALFSALFIDVGLGIIFRNVGRTVGFDIISSVVNN